MIVYIVGPKDRVHPVHSARSLIQTGLYKGVIAGKISMLYNIMNWVDFIDSYNSSVKPVEIQDPLNTKFLVLHTDKMSYLAFKGPFICTSNLKIHLGVRASSTETAAPALP